MVYDLKQGIYEQAVRVISEEIGCRSGERRRDDRERAIRTRKITTRISVRTGRWDTQRREQMAEGKRKSYIVLGGYIF